MTRDSEEDKVDVVHRHIQASNNQDREAFIDCFDSESTPHGMEFDEFVDVEFSFFDAFPDLQYPLHEVLVDGDLVAFRWTFHGRHSGKGGPDPLGSIDPTHEEVEVTGINIARVENGEIVEYIAEWNVLELLETLDIIEYST